MKTVAILLKSGKVSKVSFDSLSCYQTTYTTDSEEKTVKLKKIFQSEKESTISELNNIIGFAMLTDNVYLKFDNDNSSFVVNGKDISGVEMSE